MKTSVLQRAALLLALSLSLPSCGSSIKTTIVRRQGVDTAVRRRGGWEPRILLSLPKAYTVIGSVEVRASRPASRGQLMNRLLDAARDLDADAVAPPASAAIVDVSALAQSSNPYKPYFVSDDGTQQLLEARAIRLPRYILVDEQRWSVNDESDIQRARQAAKGQECMRVMMDLPSGPQLVTMLDGPEAGTFTRCATRE